MEKRIEEMRGRISTKKEQFITEMLKGNSKRQAFLTAFPEYLSSPWRNIDRRASSIWNDPKVQFIYKKRLAEIREKEQQEAIWGRSQSIQALKEVINKNQKELERIEEAYEEEIDELLTIAENNPKRALSVIRELAAKKRARRVSSIYNTGIISAVSELNKMQGYNEQTVNLNGSVIFTGEEEIPE